MDFKAWNYIPSSSWSGLGKSFISNRASSAVHLSFNAAVNCCAATVPGKFSVKFCIKEMKVILFLKNNIKTLKRKNQIKLHQTSTGLYSFN